MLRTRTALLATALLLILAAPAPALEDGDDVKLTTTGGLAEIGKGAGLPDVAVNTRTGESLVVFSASPDVSGQHEVYAQRVSAGGEPVGGRMSISGVGEDPDPFLVFPEPAVAYSATSDHWLVVYAVDDRTMGRPNDKFEIFARVVTADGALSDIIQVSETGELDDAADDAASPDVAWNPDRDEFLVAWSTAGSSTPGDAIRVQRLSGNGTVRGSDTTISSTGSADGGEWDTMRPGVAYDDAAGRWLVVWYAEPTPDDSFRDQEVFGQLLDGTVDATTQVGSDFRVTITGAESDHGAHAGVPLAGATNPSPRVAHDTVDGGFLVTYFGDPATGGLAADKYEVFLQRVTAAGARDGSAVRLSRTGADASAAESASAPAVAWDETRDEGVVLWSADPSASGLGDNETDIFGQRIGPGGTPIDGNFRAGHTGPDGEPGTTAFQPTVSAAGGRYQAAWAARPAATKTEIYGDTLEIPVPPLPGSTGPGGDAGAPSAPGGGVPPGSGGSPEAAARDAAKVQVLRARVRRGRLDLLAQLTARATGPLRIAFRAGGRTTTFAATPRAGRLRVDRLLPRAMRRATTGIVTLTYAGNGRVRGDVVRLRAANGRALLKRTITRITGGRLVVSGTISRRARGIVRLRLVAVIAGDVQELSFRAPIRRGRWALNTALPSAVARAGGQLDVQFTGYGPRRIRGEQLSKAVAP